MTKFLICMFLGAVTCLSSFYCYANEDNDAPLVPNFCFDEQANSPAECTLGNEPTICAIRIDDVITPVTCATNNRSEEDVVQESSRLEDSDSMSNANIVLFASFIGSNFLLPVFVPLVSAWLGAAITKSKQKRDYKPLPIKQGHRKNTVLLIGIGRSGKSELVRTLSKPLSKENIKVTENFEVHSFSTVDSNSTIIDYDITDYRGQDFSQLVSSFIKEQLVPRSKLRYGSINSLIIVVDLFTFNSRENVDSPKLQIDMVRVQEQINEWNRTAMDAVFGMLTKESLNYVCLFINKIDKWATDMSTSQKIKFAKKAYNPLISDLEKRTINAVKNNVNRKIEFKVIVGSSIKGTGLVGTEGLLPDLATYSTPMTNG